MVKLPGKFDDIPKTAKGAYDDDINCDKSEIKTKTKGLFGDIAAESTVTLKKADVATPAKLSFKIPKPFQFLDGFAVDKLEIAADGKTKVEFGLDGKKFFDVDKLKVSIASNGTVGDWSGVANLKESTISGTFTGVQDTSVKVSVKPQQPKESLAVEALRAIPMIPGGVLGVSWSLGAKGTGLCPSMAISCQHGDIFAASTFKNKFSEATLFASYKVTDDINVAAMVDAGMEKGLSKYGVCVPFRAGKDVTAKIKFESTTGSKATSEAIVALKAALAKGTTLQLGAKIDVATQAPSFGVNVSIE